MSETPTRRTGGRSQRVQEAVFAATFELLATFQVTDLSVKQIAERAGVAETTVYRRWGSLPSVIAGALSNLALEENPIPDTGSLESDLEQLLRNVVSLIEREEVRRIFRFAMSFEGSLTQARKDFWDSRFAQGATVVHRAVTRGEVPEQQDLEAVIEALVGHVYMRALIRERPITENILQESVNRAVGVAKQGLHSSA